MDEKFEARTQDTLSDETQLNTASAAKFLGVARQTLYNWQHLRKGPPYVKYSSRKVSYTVGDLRAFKNRHRIVPEN